MLQTMASPTIIAKTACLMSSFQFRMGLPNGLGRLQASMPCMPVAKAVYNLASLEQAVSRLLAVRSWEAHIC